VQQATSDRRLLQIQQADAANAAFWAWAWLIIMLCTLEGARSLSLWAYITDISSTEAQRDRAWTDELAELRHQQERARIIAETNAAVAAYSAPPEPVAAPPVAVEPPPAIELAPEPEPALVVTPEPEPIVLVEPVEMTEQERRSRLGGLAAQHNRRAEKTERLLVIGPTSTIDTPIMQVAAE